MCSMWLRYVPPIVKRGLLTKEFCKRAHHTLSLIAVNPINDLSNNLTSSLYITNPRYNVIRHKSKKKIDDDSDDEKDFLDDDKSLSKDSKVMKFTTTSLRTDAVLKSALGVARNKIEQIFYESKIRVNGKKLLKKSSPARVGYEIDVIKNVSPHNPDHLYVARVEVLNITAKEENIVFTVRRFKNLLIENYEEHPYKSGETSPAE